MTLGSSLIAVCAALGPAELLRLEGVHFRRQFRRRGQVRQEHEPPALELRSVRKVQVLGQRVVLPTARVVDGRATPRAGRAVEAHEPLAAVAGHVLDGEMAVQQNRLRAGQQAVVAIEMVPAGLHHTDRGIGEVVDRPLENRRVGHEIGVEDRDELALGRLHPVGQRPGLVAGAVLAMDVLDVEALGPRIGHSLLRDRTGAVCAVVEHLYLEAVLGVVDLAGLFDDPPGDRPFVEHGKLDSDDGQLLKRPGRLGQVLAMAVIEEHDSVPVHAVHRYHDQHDRVDRHENGLSETGPIHRVRLITGGEYRLRPDSPNSTRKTSERSSG